MTLREEVLERAAELICGDRDQVYGDPVEAHRRIALGWSGILGVHVEPAQVALCMSYLKAVRASLSPDHVDSYHDGAGYWAIAGECAKRS